MKSYDKAHPIMTRGPTSHSIPHRPLNVHGDVVVPLLQSLVSGLMLAICGVGVLWGFFGLAPVPVFLVSLAMGVIFAWFWRLDVATQTLWSIEEFAQLDLDGDGVKGNPRTVRLEDPTPTGQRVIDLNGIASDDLRQFAITALTGLNERVVCDRFDMSQETWNELRDSLVSRGILRWKGQPNSTAGVMLTEDGVGLMRRILDLSPTE